MTLLYEEREQIRKDLLAFKQPTRVPISARFSIESACGLAGIDLRKAIYDPALIKKAVHAVCETFYSDFNPVGFVRLPWQLQLNGSLNYVVSSAGAIQHPDVENMPAEEYDEYIADPVTTTLEKIQPRVLKSIQTDDPVTLRMAHMRGWMAEQENARVMNGILSEVDAKYGYMRPLAGGPTAGIPFDHISNFLRGFRGAFIDLRRCPEKIKAASAQIMKMNKWLCNRKAPEDGSGVTFLALHMPSFMSTPQFEEFYWNDFKEYVEFIVGLGWHVHIFLEGDMSRYYEHVDQLPHYRTSFLCEENHPVRMKETFGKHHFFGGLYDPTITLVHDTEKCIDEAKRLFDICGKDGGFYFCFNKNVIGIDSVDVKKLAKVLAWVHDNAVYR